VPPTFLDFNLVAQGSSLFEMELQIESLPHFEVALEADQHDMQAAGHELNPGSGGNGYGCLLDHGHGAVIPAGGLVQFDAGGYTGASLEQGVIRTGLVGDGEVNGAGPALDARSGPNTGYGQSGRWGGCAGS
jgi:hypothetical protein